MELFSFHCSDESKVRSIEISHKLFYSIYLFYKNVLFKLILDKITLVR